MYNGHDWGRGYVFVLIILSLFVLPLVAILKVTLKVIWMSSLVFFSALQQKGSSLLRCLEGMVSLAAWRSTLH